MNMHRLQANGETRDSDNWQAGIPKDVYMKSLRRHHDDAWLEHRDFNTENGMIANLCGIMFNSMGLLLEVLKKRDFVLQDFDGDEPIKEIEERRDKLNGEHEKKLFRESLCETKPSLDVSPVEILTRPPGNQDWGDSILVQNYPPYEPGPGCYDEPECHTCTHKNTLSREIPCRRCTANRAVKDTFACYYEPINEV
jgi:hypothetical protein